MAKRDDSSASSLDDMLRELAGAGNFSHLSILASNGGFVASFSPASSWGRGHSEVHADPVVAALEAIERAPKERTVSRGVRVHSPAQTYPPLPALADAEKQHSPMGDPVEPSGQANAPRPSLMGLFTNEDNDDP